MPDSVKSDPGSNEFVALMALLMSLMALSVDAMLPALGQIGADLGVKDANDVQWIITSVFAGMTFGLLLFGPLSDAIGRKRTLYIGGGIFWFGSLVSLLAPDFQIMLAGRLLQGFGASSIRVTSMAMIRDRFAGPAMGRIMSLIMIIFILVPALAPSAGQAILFFADWRGIFGLFMVLSLIGLMWLAVRQDETLATADRIPFSGARVLAGARETLAQPVARGYTIASGLIFGAFVGYLNSSQQILQIQYELGESFAIYFGVLALAIGFASYANSRLVGPFKMESICTVALVALSGSSLLFAAYAWYSGGQPPLATLIAYLTIPLFCFGLLFGNYNALAMQPLGHIAGVAGSVISFVQTLLSVFLGGLIGQLYDGTILPLVLGFALPGLASLLMTWRTSRSFSSTDEPRP